MAKKKLAKKAVSKKVAKNTATKEKLPKKKLSLTAEQIEAMEHRMRLMSKKEPLSPKLKQYLDGFMPPFGHLLRHPLLVTHVDLQHAAWVNWCIAEKEKRIPEYRKAKNWKAVMSYYEVPYLVHGFCMEQEHFDDASYWSLLGHVWILQEQLWPSQAVLLKLLKSRRPSREKLMDESEQKAFAKLPDNFAVYRGFIGKRGKGLSWTMDKKKAIWFAKRFAVLTELGEPRLMSGKVSKKDVLAYFTRRKEAEVVVDPKNVKEMETIEL